ncbi:MAG: carbon starvation CstA 5TM domain-containing protein [Candidatus Desantisbacteria bacterium]
MEGRWKAEAFRYSLMVVIAWAYLIYSGSIATIWPMFGVSNQLLAAIALGIGTTLLIKENKIQYLWVTLIPMLFMFVTTFTASWQLLSMFTTKAAQAVTATEALTFKIDAFLVLLMAILALVALLDMLWVWHKAFHRRGTTI